MDNFDLEIHRSSLKFFPDEELTGTVRWVLAKAPAAIEIVLFWHTEGKGTRDAQTVAHEIWETPGPYGEKTFRFTLPQAPHSFHGTLISLEWGIEALVRKGKAKAYEQIILSPTGAAIQLGDPPQESADPGNFKRKLLSFSFSRK